MVLWGFGMVKKNKWRNHVKRLCPLKSFTMTLPLALFERVGSVARKAKINRTRYIAQAIEEKVKKDEIYTQRN